MRRCLGTLLLLLATAALRAEGDGGQPAAWSKLALGARSAALGQAVNALADDPSAALLNPALAASLPNARVGSQAAFLPDGRQWHYLGLARPFGVGSDYAWTLGYAQYTVDQAFERRRGNTGVPDSFFRESASLTQLGLAAWVLERRVAVGLSLKVLSHALGDASGGGAVADLGFLWRSQAWLDLGLAFRDVGSRLGWSNGHAETLLPRLRLAAQLRPWGERLGILLETEASQEQAMRLRAGLEAWPWPGRLALRAGLDGGQPAAGLGFRWPLSRAEAGLDYALVVDPLGRAALQHRFSLEFGLPL